MNYQQHLETITQIGREFRYCKSVESLFELDQWSALPRQGVNYRQEMAAYVAREKTRLYCTDQAAQEEEYFAQVPLSEIGDEVERGVIRTFLQRRRVAARTPEDLQRQYSLIKAQCMEKWKQAREAKDYRIFQPWLQQAFDLKGQIAKAINPDRPAFDTLVGLTDDGADVEEISREFDVLKEGLKALMHKLSQGRAPRAVEYPQGDPAAMSAFAQSLARELGFPTDLGTFNDQVVHGFTSFMGPRDARVSTYRSGSHELIFTCLHEAGHAMYSTGSSQKVIDAGLWGGIEGGFHEANSRFYENMVGRSRAYWDYCFPKLVNTLPQFAGMDQDTFYLGLHRVQPSLKRIASDEVTYSLHAILRFELERDYFAGKLRAEDMAQAWNRKYQDYLGLCPPDDTQGVLQDMHWAGDYIGYFQSYALGNIYDGQILQALERDKPDWQEDIRRGKFGPLNDWMRENIWSHGCCLTAGELVKQITGSSLDARPFLKYLDEKYSVLYGLAPQ